MNNGKDAVPTEPGRDSALPDFERDEQIVQAYEAAKARYVRQITASSEAKLREAYGKRREKLLEEIADLRDVLRQRTNEATVAAKRYGNVVPNRVQRGIRPPSLWERLRTFNAVSKLYKAAAKASSDVDDVNNLLRKQRNKMDTIERDMKRSIYLREESVRKKLTTPEGIAALHGDPVVRGAYNRLQVVLAERAKFEERVKNGEVPQAEILSRVMQQRGFKPAAAPIAGAMIAQLVRIGKVEYYVLRDLGRIEYLLTASPSIEPLRDVVFDLNRTREGIAASIRNGASGTPMRVLDHLKECFPDGDTAGEMFRRHRQALRKESPKGEQVPNAGEAEVIAALATLANAVKARGTAAPVASSEDDEAEFVSLEELEKRK